MSLVLEIKLSELSRDRCLGLPVETRIVGPISFMVAPELLEAYKRTEFIVDLPDRQAIICHGQRNARIERALSEHSARTAAYVTAHNPNSQRLSAGDNCERYRLLIADVELRGFAYLTGRGVGHDSTWPAEESLFIIGVSHDEATALGRKHGQLAIVWVETGKPAQIVLC